MTAKYRPHVQFLPCHCPQWGCFPLPNVSSDCSHCRNECGFSPGFKPGHSTAHTVFWARVCGAACLSCLHSFGYPLKVGLQSAGQASLSWVKLQGEAIWKHSTLQCYRIESLKLERPPRPSSSTSNWIPPHLLNHIMKCHVHPFFEHFQVTPPPPWGACFNA